MSFRSEFQRKHFFFTGVTNSELHRVSQCVPSGGLLVYRTFITLYLLASTGVAVWDATHWLTYLTTWSFLLCTLYYTLLTCATWYHHCARNSITDHQNDEIIGDENEFATSYYRYENADNVPSVDDDDDNVDGDVTMSTEDVDGLRAYSKVVWVLFEMSLVVSFLVTLMFWVFVMQPERAFRSHTRGFRSVNEHAINFLLLLIDFSFHRMPVRVLHMVYPVTFALIYMTFNLVYTFVTKQPVYSILDWIHHPAAGVGYVCMAIGLLVLGQIMFYALHRLKVACCGRRGHTSAYRRMDALL